MRIRNGFRRPGRAALLLAVGVAGGGAALAVASVPDGNGQIHACVNVTTQGGVLVPQTGLASPNVTVIDPGAGQHCIPDDGTVTNQTTLSWNVTGPPGLPGATGARGEPGSGNSYTVTVVPPIIRANESTEAHVTLRSGRDARTFDILAFAFAPTSTSGTGSGAGAGKVKFNEFHITKAIDQSSPKLMLDTGRGTHFDSAIIVIARKAGKGKQQFIKITLTHVIISSFQMGSGGRGSAPPLETLTLSFASSAITSK